MPARTKKTEKILKYERAGTKPRKGDRVVSLHPSEANTPWAVPHTVVSVRKDDNLGWSTPLGVRVRKLKGDGDKQVSYSFDEFGKTGCNRVIKRK